MPLDVPAAIATADPVFALPPVDGVERRACVRAHQLWRSRCEGRRFPLRASLSGAELGELGGHGFVVAIASPIEDSTFVECGAVPADALERDPVGLRLADALSGRARRRALDAIRFAAELGIPVDDSGSWRRADGRVLLYRAVLMPLSDDQRRVDHVLGVLSFRLVHAV